MNRTARLGSFMLVMACVPAWPAHLAAQPRAGGAARAAAQVPTATIDLSRMKASTIEVEQASGRGREVAGESSRVRIAPWQYVAARTGVDVQAVAPLQGQEQAWALPVVLSTADDAGEQIDLEIVVAVDNGLMLRGSDGVYTGDVFVGVLNRQNRAASRPLGAPVHVLLGGLVDAIEPAGGVEIRHTNQPFTRVAIRARPTDERVLLTARASFASDGADVPIPVVRPRLMLHVSPPEIQGLGLETATVTVRAEGHPNPEGIAVTFDTTAGRMEPADTVLLNAQGVATASLRATALGSAMVGASAAGFRAADQRPVTFGWPVWFIGSGIVGGLVGAFLRHQPRRGTKTGLQSPLVKGTLRGLVVAALFAVGFNVFGWAPTARAGAAMVAVTALLGVWVDLGALAKRGSGGA